MFWLSWFMVSLSFFYWFSLSSLMVLNSPLSFFFFFFFNYNKNEFLFTSMNNKISLANMMFFYFYDL